ncbi:cytochrome b/b6 domain-containing protein [Yanghanlia caeni]|uniref:Cytochrome b/b6 domain-containing protein n=1 Tax=Yanghanlia caeni TaxID=3064283 RepID=A0ABU1D5I7_9BURK|nr:cytochrome b/b6 domain-containing protein [Alcaligenaceae bacterium LG-2]HZH56339.1 cytochrome b/b6 domain-containing protein [Burkholderiaceae bacterium]
MNPTIQRIRVWDLPTRLFHWLLVLCVIGAFVTVKAGVLWMDWHVRFGLAALALLAFRIVWGLLGPRYARFSHFVKGPVAVMRYLHEPQEHGVGHNPLGGWSVVTMLVLLTFQAVSGLFTTDDVLTSGPLAYLNSEWTATLTNLHKLNEWVLIVMVAVHVAAVLAYQARGRRLIGAMIHGDALLDSPAPVRPAADTWRVRVIALVLITLFGLGAAWLTTFGASGDALDFM